MKKLSFVLFLALMSACSQGKSDASLASYTTSKGAVFTQVQGPGVGFGQSWKDPGGTIWSAYQGDYANTAIKPDQNGMVTDSPATEACSKIGGTLPTEHDYSNLMNYFDHNADDPSGGEGRGMLTYQGQQDLSAIFPDMKGTDWRNFWSSSINYGSYTFFESYHGVTDYSSNRDTVLSVRCVSR